MGDLMIPGTRDDAARFATRRGARGAGLDDAA